jgi:hypothetical protein
MTVDGYFRQFLGFFAIFIDNFLYDFLRFPHILLAGTKLILNKDPFSVAQYMGEFIFVFLIDRVILGRGIFKVESMEDVLFFYSFFLNLASAKVILWSIRFLFVSRGKPCYMLE